MKENEFQRKLVKKLQVMFPGCIVLKNDCTYLQGFPDLIVLYKKHWAVLECKRSLNESYRPNQKTYIDICNKMSAGFMICPENQEEVLNELQRAFRA